MENAVNSESKKLMTIHDVARRLNCSTRLVYTMKSLGRIPSPIKLGRLIRWDGEVIDKWIADGCQSQVKKQPVSKWKR